VGYLIAAAKKNLDHPFNFAWIDPF